MTTTYKTADEFKREYFRKHGGMETCSTSPMYNFDTYIKTYTTGDGNTLTEVNESCFRPETWTTEGGYTVTDDVRRWRTEIWTTTDASRIWYTRY